MLSLLEVLLNQSDKYKCPLPFTKHNRPSESKIEKNS